MAINPYLIFDGEGKEAVTFYAQVFGIEQYPLMTFGDSPQDPSYTLPEEAKNLVMHAMLEINGAKLMFSDTFPGQPFLKGNNISLAYVSSDEAENVQIFEALAKGGDIIMPLQKTFWSKSYGSLKDRYGIEWQVSLEDSTEA
ncbi:VOC family protein [Solibacillus sp. FSL H8-0538]|uniref:VOC family protein n=1 Tax=Solibacillus sp. FSL H8-0538 TaxID=2921400 RepID=UPI0030F8391C